MAGKQPNHDEPKPNGGAYVPPPDVADIAALYTDTGQGDPLTAITMHKVPVGRPKNFFRTVSDPSYRRRVEMYCHKPENAVEEEHYIVGPKLRGQIDEAQPCLLITVVDRAGMPRLWPIKLPKDGGKDNICWQTCRDIARTGLTEWVRAVFVNVGVGFVERRAEEGYAPDPDFTRLPSFDELVQRVFGEHGIIHDESHPIYRELFGLTRPKSDTAFTDELT